MKALGIEFISGNGKNMDTLSYCQVCGPEHCSGFLGSCYSLGLGVCYVGCKLFISNS